MGELIAFPKAKTETPTCPVCAALIGRGRGWDEVIEPSGLCDRHREQFEQWGEEEAFKVIDLPQLEELADQKERLKGLIERGFWCLDLCCCSRASAARN